MKCVRQSTKSKYPPRWNIP